MRQFSAYIKQSKQVKFKALIKFAVIKNTRFKGLKLELNRFLPKPRPIFGRLRDILFVVVVFKHRAVLKRAV